MQSSRTHLDRILGCLFGGAIGDCVGSSIEGRSSPDDVLELPWHWTDDTQLTLATCEALAESHTPDPSTIAEHMAEWFRTGRVTGLGASTRAALTALRLGAHWALAGASGEFAAGNGAAMRIAPLAFFLNPHDTKDRRTIRDVARITHKNDEAYAGALAVVVAVRNAVLDAPQSGILGRVADSLPDSRTRDALHELTELPSASRTYTSAASAVGTSGFVAESVPIALFAADLALRDGFFPVLGAISREGGDIDTIASIAGQVLGARLGFQGLPPELVSKVPDSQKIHSIGARLARSALIP